MNTFVFDIETIPDIASARKIYALSSLSDLEVYQAVCALRRQEAKGSEFLPLHLQQIVAISLVLRTPTQLKVWSLGTEDAKEPELLERFFDGLEKFQPTLVSWNGCNFDLPVIHYRSLLHGIQAPTYWETGDMDHNFRWNNYLNRYHHRHTDLLDILAGYQSRGYAPLDDIALMLGLPGKGDMHGSQVWDYFQRGDIALIRNYCETDVLNTYLVYLRFELMRGKISLAAYQEEVIHLQNYLRDSKLPHFIEFLNRWS